MKQRLYPGVTHHHHPQQQQQQQPTLILSPDHLDWSLRTKPQPQPQKPNGASNFSIPSRHPPHQLLPFHTPIRHPVGQRQAPPVRPDQGQTGKTLQTVSPPVKPSERRPTQGPSSQPPPTDPPTSLRPSDGTLEVSSRTVSSPFLSLYFSF